MANKNSVKKSNTRPMRYSDLHDVQLIEQQVYEYPWSRTIMSDCIRTGYICRIIEVDFELVGYGFLSFAAGESHLLNLSISPQHQGKKLGRVMLERLLKEAVKNSVGCTYLEVRPSNTSAVALYKSHGFNQIGIRKGYYPTADGREDALVLSINLATEPGFTS